MLTIYTDGACEPNPGIGAYAYVVLEYGVPLVSGYGSYRHTTNNRMELMAVLEALKFIALPTEINLYSDSKYVVNAFEKGWLKNWQRRNWLRATGEPVLNEDLWREIDKEVSRHDVRFIWIRGHDGNHWNEQVDQMAQSQLGVDMLVDTAYEELAKGASDGLSA